jgi:hypothetical protein
VKCFRVDSNALVLVPFLFVGRQLKDNDRRPEVVMINKMPVMMIDVACALTGTKINVTDFDGEDASLVWLANDFARTKPFSAKPASKIA